MRHHGHPGPSEHHGHHEHPGRPGHPDGPEPAEHGEHVPYAEHTGRTAYSGDRAHGEHLAYPVPFAEGPVGEPVPVEDPAAAVGDLASGRHRKDGGARRSLPRRPSFRTAVIAAGATAAVLTVATGVYLASPPARPPAAVPAADPATLSDAPTAKTAPAPSARPTPARVEPMAVAERLREQQPARPGEQGRQRGAATGAEAPAGKVSRLVRDVIALANAEREKAGCGPLRDESRLRAAAQGHADDMAARDYYKHENPEGRDAGDRMSDAGYAWSTWGENIHRGPKTPAQAMDDWMESPGHRANVLNCSFKDIGVGVALTADGPWWVQDFGAKR
ncbi:CAP domain-containing protein [Streptomyces sp. NPDC058664]|uniref:CAP domain-containing protein n=1 Tax=unclassified Streptomyces TaxID=2593676 RepID=UPI003655B882